MKIIATAIAFATAALMLAPTAAHAEQPATRVLVVGDSVTQGKDGDHSWRYFAARELTTERYAFDFVGPYRGTKIGDGARNQDGTYADPDFDQDHAARWGLTMWEALYLDTDAPTIGELVAAQQPDVIVEALGINDYSYRYGEAERGMLLDHARELVAQARKAKPDVDIVLGTLPQRWEGERVDWYNAALPALAAELSTVESRITTTAVAQWTRGVDTYDAVHPTQSGEEKLAAVVVDALVRLLPLPLSPEPTPEPVATAPEPAPVSAPTSSPAAAPAPSKPANVRATQKGSRVVVRWQQVDGSESYAVRCGSRSKSTTRTTATLRGHATRCKVRAVAASMSPWTVTRVKQQR